jgi:hypothetical protein
VAATSDGGDICRGGQTDGASVCAGAACSRAGGSAVARADRIESTGKIKIELPSGIRLSVEAMVDAEAQARMLLFVSR